MKRAFLVFLGLLGSPALARAADEDEDAYARVVVAEAELRAGPGVSHRVIYRAPRGEAFLITTRETAGFWLQVQLPDAARLRVGERSAWGPTRAKTRRRARQPVSSRRPPAGQRTRGFA